MIRRQERNIVLMKQENGSMVNTPQASALIPKRVVSMAKLVTVPRMARLVDVDGFLGKKRSTKSKKKAVPIRMSSGER